MLEPTASLPRAVSEPARSAGSFFVAAFAITWLLQLPAILALSGVIAGPPERFMLLVGLGGFGPMAAAILIARSEGGREGVGALLRPLRAWRVNPIWYLVALAMPGAILTAGMAVDALFNGHTGLWFYRPKEPERIVALLVFPFGEEIGWRGFALPRLQARFGAVLASVILGVLWAAWHIPMLALAGIPAFLFAPMIAFFVAGTVVFTWVYNRTSGSLLLAVLLHMGAHLDNSHRPLPADPRPFFVHAAAYCAVALVLVLIDRKAFGITRATSS